MAASRDTASILSFTHAQFFQQDDSLLADREFALAGTDLIGLALAAPSEIATRREQRLPLILAHRRTALRAWEIVEHDNMVLAGVDLDSDEVRFARVYEQLEDELFADQEAPERPPKPRGDDAKSALTGLSRIDARRLLDLRWDSASYAFAAISFDWASNAVQVRLLGEGPPAQAKPRPVQPPLNVDALPVKKPPLFRKAALQQFPCYLPTFRTPAPPKQPGVALTVEAGAGPDPTLGVYGSFLVRLRARHLRAEPERHRLADGTEHSAVAVVPMTFALLGIDWPLPFRADWGVPVYGTAPATEGQLAGGCFAIDPIVGAARRPRLKPGRYAAFVVLDGDVHGPATFEIKPQ